MSESSHGVVDATFPLIGGCKPGLDSMVLPSTSQKANQRSQKPFPRPQAYNLPSSGSPRVQGLCRVLSHWSAPAAGELPVQALPHLCRLCRLCPTSAGSAPPLQALPHEEFWPSFSSGAQQLLLEGWQVFLQHQPWVFMASSCYMSTPIFLDLLSSFLNSGEERHRTSQRYSSQPLTLAFERFNWWLFVIVWH